MSMITRESAAKILLFAVAFLIFSYGILAIMAISLIRVIRV